MKIAIANDHNGVKLKQKIKLYLNKCGYEIIDFGSNNNEKVDYPNYAFHVGESVVSNESQLGILICGTGIGMSIACNKVKGIRCAKVSTEAESELARKHNNANVIAISSRLSNFKAMRIIKKFLRTKFSNEERHIRRNELIDKYCD